MNYAETIKEIVTRISPSPTVYVHSFGCRLNVSDGNSLLGKILDMGFAETEDVNSASLIIINTCAVRENAEKKVYGVIGELKHVKEKNPDVIIAVCGCMTQEKHVAEFIKNTYRHVDFCFGTFAYKKFPELLYNALTKNEFQCDNNEYPNDFSDFNLYQKSVIKADVPIMYGCDNYCSYCIVPYVRGRERSREVSDILSDIRTLTDNGFKEILLLGQNVNSYGNTLKPPVPFSELLKQAAEIPGDFKIRFMSPHPKDMRKDLIDIIAEYPKLCKSIHLPLQSGSNRILELMNRQYTAETYMEIVKYIRKKMPRCTISTDIIVGFPGETEYDFEETLRIIKEAHFYNIFSFIYSKRTGTKAADLPDYATAVEKTSRMTRMLTLQREIATETYAEYVEKTLTVLFDGSSKTEGLIAGKSDEGIIVEAPGTFDKIGEYRKVRITKSHNWALEGVILNF
ncbi:MAG: tRNA (N6-isopentenyl adenosine(37)-C2)-methylthiotransferase MiaB [Ruminococcus sp.]|jgi:tRNA-2-methylthio-N6-dimethylallyladenosine synthase|nr:tRNA (N6-isopentenyl adenosine(37)-C2)-methylthiotransferase MiaB [Ruminococcus sp.]